MTTGLTKLEGPMWSYSSPCAEVGRGPKEMNVTPSSVAGKHGSREENTQLNLMTNTSSVKAKHKEIRVMSVF